MTKLVAVKLLHTLAWIFLVACILAIPVSAQRRDLRSAAIFSGIIWIECVLLVWNRWRCPSTDWAARYTDAREDNFDIYLPLWLARYNKIIFGTIFAASELFLLSVWLRS